MHCSHLEEPVEREPAVGLAQTQLYDCHDFSVAVFATFTAQLPIPFLLRGGRSAGAGAGTVFSHGQHERIAGEGEIATAQAAATPRLDSAQYLY